MDERAEHKIQIREDFNVRIGERRRRVYIVRYLLRDARAPINSQPSTSHILLRIDSGYSVSGIPGIKANKYTFNFY